MGDDAVFHLGWDVAGVFGVHGGAGKAGYADVFLDDDEVVADTWDLTHVFEGDGDLFAGVDDKSVFAKAQQVIGFDGEGFLGQKCDGA